MIEVVCVIGHEGSGTQWLTWLLSQHPDIGRILHISYPVTWRGSPYIPLTEYGKSGREYGDVESMRDRTAPLVVTMRDQNCSRMSNERRGFFKVDPSRRDRHRASREMWRDIHAWNVPAVDISYEGLVEEGRPYLDMKLRQIGADPATFDWKEYHPDDGNLKYFK